MRTLILLRGAPGCGKTTWIQNMGLTEYTLSADQLRLMHAAPVLSPDGSMHISQREDRRVWDTLFGLLEYRMERGDFTVIDACNSKTSEMTRYKDLATKYRYRIYCVDMTDIPIDVVKERNASRPPLKFVPEDYIDRVYSRFATQAIPSGIQKVHPNTFWEEVGVKPFDLSSYNAVVHIGDIHGCYDTLATALKVPAGQTIADAIPDDVAFIFHGDYIDRGPDSAKVLKALMEIANRPNVCLLEGNHEQPLWRWANDMPTGSHTFEKVTLPQLIDAGITKKDVRMLVRRMRQCSYYTYRGFKVLCTHGGLSSVNCRLDLVPTVQMIRGVGAYEDMEACCDSFASADSPIADYQFFGHRNVNNLPVSVNDACGCLEGYIERGGYLRMITMTGEDKDFELISVSIPAAASDRPYNPAGTIPPAASDDSPEEASASPESCEIAQLVEQMRSSRDIMERKFGHFSSFNFTRNAFEEKRWNSITTRARGMFIDTVHNTILARGYEKFFAINERQDTRLSELKKTLTFPVIAYRKENGYLGLASYDHAADCLFLSTKGTPIGPMADRFRQIVASYEGLADRLTAYLKENNVTILFEVIDPENDPHIIRYNKPKLVLLDIVKNTLDFCALPSETRAKVVFDLHVDAKKMSAFIENATGLEDYYATATSPGYQEDGQYIEGHVLCDANGYMVKVKTDYYRQWKKLRGIAASTLKHGHYRHTSHLTTPLENYFYAWVKSMYKQIPADTDIITLRERFFETHDKEGIPIDPH